jgi:AcrR family transcriptional regulator
MSPRRAKAITGRVDQDPATALREHLVNVAEKLLAERQVSTITTRDIARAADVSGGVLYNYFADKHDLLLAALLRRYDGLADRFDAAIPEPGSGTIAANLHAFARAALDFQAELIPMAAGLLSEPALLHRFLDAIHGEPSGPQHRQGRLRGYLAAEKALGRLPEDVDANAATTLLMGASLTLIVAGHLLPAHLRPDPAAQLPGIVDTLLRGLTPAPVA